MKQHLIQRICRHKSCDVQFQISRSNQYYCSQSCRQKEYLSRNGFKVSRAVTDNEVKVNQQVRTEYLNNKNGSIPALLSGIVAKRNTSLTDIIDGLRKNALQRESSNNKEDWKYNANKSNHIQNKIDQGTEFKKHKVVSELLSGIVARKNTSFTNLIDGLKQHAQNKEYKH